MAETVDPRQRVKVAVVNDDLTQRKVLEGLLAREGLLAYGFESSDSALKEFANPLNLPDLIVSDLHMPGIDGWSLCRLLRSPEYAALNTVPILIVSATYAGEDVRQICVASGADAFLASPVDGAVFLKQVRALLMGKAEHIAVRVMVVEDSTSVAGALKEGLETSGYQVVVAPDGRTARRLFVDTKPDLVVLDYHLPDTTGEVLLEDFAGEQSRPTVVMMTSDSDPELAAKWIKCGAAAYVRKPFKIDYLVTLCGRVLRERSLLRIEDLLEARSRQLAASEERYRQILKGITDYIYTVRVEDGKAVETTHGPGCVAVTGYCEEEFAADAFLWHSMMPTEDRSRVEEQARRLLRGEDAPPIEHRIVRKDGAVRWVSNTPVLHRGEGGHVLGYDGLVRDVTERVQAEAALVEREKQQALLLANLPGVIYRCRNDRDRTMQYISEQCYALTGYTAADLIENKRITFNDLVVTEYRESLWEKWQEVLAKSAAFQEEYPIQTASGEIKWVWERGRGVIDDAGKLHYIEGYIEDVSERKDTQQRLGLSEARYHQLIESMSEGLAVTNRDLRFTFVNERFCEMLGRPREEIVGRRVNEFISEDCQGLLQEQRSMRVRGEADKYELAWNTKDGGVVYTLVSPRVVLDDEGHYSGSVGILLDITDHKRVDEELRESEARFRSTFEQAAVGMAHIGLDLRYLRVNQKLCDITGYTAEELLNITFLEITHPEDRDENISMHEHMAGGRYDSCALQKRYLHRNGSVVWVGVTVSLIRDSSGREKYYSAVIEDISDRKQAEEELRKSEQQLADIIEFLPDATFVVDNEKRVVAWNLAIEEMTGVDKRDMIGQGDYAYTVPFYGERRTHLLDLLDVTDEALEAKYQKVQKRGNTLYAETFTNALYGGKGAYVFATVAPLFDVHGNRIGAIESIRDITERKKAEEELSNTRQTLSNIIESLPDATIVVDHDYKVIAWNSAIAKMTGIPKEEMIGKGDYEYGIPFYGERRPMLIDLAFMSEEELRKYYDAAKKEGDTVYGEVFVPRIYGGKGAYIWASASLLFDQSGNVAGAIESIRDITERKELDAALRQAQKIESVGRLAAGVAHDLNNMLSPILGYSDLLLLDLDSSDSRYAQVLAIRRAAEQSKSLVRQLLAFSRKQVLQLKVVDLREVVDEVKPLLRRTLRENIDLEIVTRDAPCRVTADVGQVEQILMNLTVNAQDAMANGGRLIIEVSEFDLDEDYCSVHPGAKTGRYAALIISDTGCGMDEETLQHIFEPFFSTKGELGTGLGLATVYGIAKQHGGTIQVYSEPGKGTTFRIYLPLNEAEVEKATVKVSEPVALKGSETVLLVEDNEVVREVVRVMLERQGYKVHAAASGGETLALIEGLRGTLDLMLTDVVMPDTNGKALYQQVSAKHPEAKVVFMSGYTDDVIGHHGILEPGVDFISKPFSAQALASKVRMVLDEK